MPFYTRKLLPGDPGTEAECYIDPNECHTSLLPPPPPHQDRKTGNFMVLLIVLCLLGGALVFLSYFTVLRFRSSLRRARRRAAAAASAPEMGQDFIDENQGPIADHPIWYIRTIGLPQSIIESILIFRFRKGDGLIEGSDCAICLSDFQEDESLRLLPKCSHAFHSQCIDQWLRSHKNCPVCRAPILSTPVNAVSVAVEAQPPPENRATSQQDTDAETETTQNGETDPHTILISIPPQDDKPIGLNLGDFRALSDLTDHYRIAAVCNEEPPVRRSSSMVNFPAPYRDHLGPGSSGSTTAKRECENSSSHGLTKGSSNGRRPSKATHR